MDSKEWGEMREYQQSPHDAADLLAEMTGNGSEEFVPDGIEIPRFEDQEVVDGDE